LGDDTGTYLVGLLLKQAQPVISSYANVYLDRKTGKPYYNVIVWNDTRTMSICEELRKEGGIDRFRKKTGLPISSYFSASKILWVFDNVPGVREDAVTGDAMFGTIDTWLVYKLTGKT